MLCSQRVWGIPAYLRFPAPSAASVVLFRNRADIEAAAAAFRPWLPGKGQRVASAAVARSVRPACP
eukprot:6912482-Alexandrium_andersonii.AAC.1